MSSTSTGTEAAVTAAQVTAPAVAKPRDAKAPETSAAPEAAKSGLGNSHLSESITSVAEQAQQGKVNTLESISGVADDIREAIDTLNDALAKAPTKAIISRDDQLNRFIVKIADERSGEVIREIPSEAVLKFARNLREIKGLLFDKLL